MAIYIVNLNTTIEAQDGPAGTWRTPATLSQDADVNADLSNFLQVYGLSTGIGVYASASAWFPPPDSVDIDGSTDVFVGHLSLLTRISLSPVNVDVASQLEALRTLQGERVHQTDVAVHSSLVTDLVTESRYQLFETGGETLNLYPDFDYEENDQLMLSELAVNNGAVFSYVWGQQRSTRFTASYVTSAQATQINSWWGARTQLTGRFVNHPSTLLTGRLMGENKPCRSYTDGARQYFIARIELEE